MKYGYARVGTDDQNPALQMDALKKAERVHIFQDKLTGATSSVRHEGLKAFAPETR